MKSKGEYQNLFHHRNRLKVRFVFQFEKLVSEEQKLRKINLFINNGFLHKQISFFHNTDFLILSYCISSWEIWIFFKKGLKMHIKINNGKFILSLWNFTTAFRFIIAFQKVFNKQNPRTLGFRGLSLGILAHLC